MGVRGNSTLATSTLNFTLNITNGTTTGRTTLCSATSSICNGCDTNNILYFYFSDCSLTGGVKYFFETLANWTSPSVGSPDITQRLDFTAKDSYANNGSGYKHRTTGVWTNLSPRDIQLTADYILDCNNSTSTCENINDMILATSTETMATSSDIGIIQTRSFVSADGKILYTEYNIPFLLFFYIFLILCTCLTLLFFVKQKR